ncbi:unnamed protein product [Caenorhabditis auriculariae]|uniref:Uncharacterized protein n=1 Tax=Caenorhabditis auriculariae TaxID=2777116 RepID=A0A8S1H222_9PELO|nr:unnamed protein product [Caenorhabditis auriculariae]
MKLDPSQIQVTTSGKSTIQNAQPSRPSRRAPMQMCFNAGDLGEVCCCNTDFCNSARFHKSFLLFPVLIYFLVSLT